MDILFTIELVCLTSADLLGPIQLSEGGMDF